MKTTVWIVTTCIPERGETTPCLPSVYATEAEAEAYADASMQSEWENNQPEGDDGEPLPYPGDWREAMRILTENDGEGTWGEWQITSHEITPVEIEEIMEAEPRVCATCDRMLEDHEDRYCQNCGWYWAGVSAGMFDESEREYRGGGFDEYPGEITDPAGETRLAMALEHRTAEGEIGIPLGGTVDLSAAMALEDGD